MTLRNTCNVIIIGAVFHSTVEPDYNEQEAFQRLYLTSRDLIHIGIWSTLVS